MIRASLARWGLLFGLGLMIASTASAEVKAGEQNVPVDARLALSWRAPVGCPSADQVRVDVRSLMAKGHSGAGEPLVVAATIRKGSDRNYELVLSHEDRERIIPGDSCTRLAQAAALLIALLLDPALELAEPEPSASEAKPAAPGPTAGPALISAPRVPQEPESTVPTRRSPWVPVVLAIQVGGRLEVGAWPSAEPGLVLGAGLTQDGPRGGLLARLLLGLGAPVHVDAGQGATLSLIPATLSLAAGYRLQSKGWGLEPLLGGELGRIQAQSSVLETRDNPALSFSLLGLVRGTRDLGHRLRVWIGPGLVLPLWRPHWVLADGSVLHILNPALRLEVGLEALF